MRQIRSCPLPKKNRCGSRPYLIAWGGTVVMLTVMLFPAMVWTDTGICGYPASGRVMISRADQTMAEFTVTTAESVAQRRRGLMNCPMLSPGTGMLFIYENARPRAFWMKDTPLELGIIFIANDGRITSIEKGTPGNLTRIPSPGPVQYVLEINYQETQGLRIGDRMQSIAPDTTWPETTGKGKP